MREIKRKEEAVATITITVRVEKKFTVEAGKRNVGEILARAGISIEDGVTVRVNGRSVPLLMGLLGDTILEIEEE